MGRRVCSFLFGLVFVLCLEGFVNAEVSVDPSVVEVVVRKGEIRKGVFRVVNTDSKPKGVVVQPERWRDFTTDFNEWLKLDIKEFTVNTRESRTINYEIKVPEDASGELMCMVFFTAEEKGEEASNIGMRFGIPIYVIVQDTGELKAKIKGIKVSYFKEEHLLKGEILINNRSNVHIRPDIEVVVFNEKGDAVLRDVVPYKQPVQKKEIRPVFFQLNTGLAPGKYRILVTADCGRLYGIDRVIRGKGEFVVR